MRCACSCACSAFLAAWICAACSKMVFSSASCCGVRLTDISRPLLRSLQFLVWELRTLWELRVNGTVQQVVSILFSISQEPNMVFMYLQHVPVSLHKSDPTACSWHWFKNWELGDGLHVRLALQTMCDMLASVNLAQEFCTVPAV